MICIDSDCIIDFLRNKPNAVKAVEKWKEQLVTTEINRFQVLFGIFDKDNVSQKELSAAQRFFSLLDVLPFGEGCGESGAKMLAMLRKHGEEIEESDCFIAASALKVGCKKILTNNKKHFERIPEMSAVAY